MTAEEILTIVQEKGITLEVKGSKLKYRAPANAIDQEFIELLRKHKQGIIEALRGEGMVTLDYCRQKQCEYLFNHAPNPRCSHPQCTGNERYISGLGLGILARCPKEAGELIWKH